jgi:predicted alpha/beta hydrolase family esterase
MERRNIILIGGGDSFSNREDFLEYLKTVDVRDLPQENPRKSWKYWVKEELSDGYYFDIPSMPNTHNARYDEWKIWFERHLDAVEDSVVLIGLSLGAQFLAKYLIENSVKQEIKGLFLLAGPCGYFEDPDGMDCATFGFKASDLGVIQEKVNEITIMHSKDDFVVPYEHALKYKEALPEAELVTFEDKNHFLVEELPELVGRIRVL